ncbi:MAG: hypothetical protein HYS09_02345 [Chloroflexi bacterium]|nr:hypothetical protein [Chloroflexota bacterium]
MRRFWFRSGFVPPFGFWFRSAWPFPRMTEYLRALEDYKRELEEELREVNEEIERLRKVQDGEKKSA